MTTNRTASKRTSLAAVAVLLSGTMLLSGCGSSSIEGTYTSIGAVTPR